MAGGTTNLDAYIAESLEKIKGTYFPVRSNLLTRMLVKKAACKSLYPNPKDEFSMPDIGPNDEIISSYEREYLDNIKRGGYYYGTHEPIIVERLHPEGYMIINGHHRWGAAMKIGQAKIPVRIVNLMHEADVREILQNTQHEKRAAFDLDEVLLRAADDPYLEKPLSFPWNRIYQERIRLGVPSLFHYLELRGYDIWLYSTKYHSADAVQDYFRRYHVKVSGVISAVGKRKKGASWSGIEKLIQSQYRETLHIDNDMVLQIFNDTKEHREFPVSGAPDTWSREIIEALDKLEQESSEAQAQTG